MEKHIQLLCFKTVTFILGAQVRVVNLGIQIPQVSQLMKMDILINQYQDVLLLLNNTS